MSVQIDRGMVIQVHHHTYLVEDFQERHSGKQKPTVHVTLKDLKDGRHVEKALDELQPIHPLDHFHRAMQFSYSRGPTLVFLDAETFEELPLDDSLLPGFRPLLREGQEFRVLFVDGLPIHVDLPDSVALRVKSTAAPERSVGQGGGVLKDATFENGLAIRVPLFIKPGDLVRIRTEDHTYVGKEKEPHA